jgi:hypothetical protein
LTLLLDRHSPQKAIDTSPGESVFISDVLAETRCRTIPPALCLRCEKEFLPKYSLAWLGGERKKMEWKSTALRSLWAPLFLTPEQYYDDRRGDSSMRPIKRLMLAVLEDALSCLHTHANPKNRERQLIYQEAEQWLLRKERDGLFSFSSVCETLGIAPDYLRAGLGRWRDMQSHGRYVRRPRSRSPVARDRSISSGAAPRSRGIRDSQAPL